MDRKQFLIERMRLKNIKEEINNLEGVSVINIYERADIYPKYKDALDNIYKIEFPVLTTKEIGDENYKYVEYLYKYLKLQTDSYRWLVPGFNCSYWWLELEVSNLCNFIDYYSGNSSLNFTAIDTNNNLLFDIGLGEDDFEYCTIWL